MKLNITYVTLLIAVIMIPSAFADTVSTEIDNTTYEIEYTSNNVIIKSVTAIATTSWQSLIFETDVSDTGGDISITFQRDFFDAKFGTEIDDEFFILSDGDEIEFEETKTDESLTLSFSLSVGTEEVEIIATLPTLDEARAKIIGILATPAQKIISILLAPGSKIAILALEKSKKN